MAEGIISDLVIKALEVLGKAAFKEAASWCGARDELTKLGNTMRLIQARVRDAEKRQEDDGSESIREWLRRLRLVLYRADDLFDEVITLDRQKQRMKSTVAKVGILFSKFGPLYYNRRLANEIMSIRKELDAIKSDMAGLDLRDLSAEERPMARLLGKRETASFVNAEDVIGRDNDKNNIIKMLFDTKFDNQRVAVIPIVGFGGLGKTTLAQLVFNDEMVKKHFDLIKWAYVPEKENMTAIMGKIFKSFTGKDHQNLPLEEIKQGIRDTIESNKYLLVLDDLWDEGGDRLIDLMNLLKCGKQGSKVIVTTRSGVVARIVGTIVPYKLGTLTPDESWDLFKMLAFKQENQDNNPVFSVIGKEIVTMCGDVPLAIKVVGGFLRSMDTEEEWLQARDAQRSKAQLSKGNDIMDVLKVSYDYLLPVLKQCFAYCSFFPKGGQFDRDDLVNMWMAQGYFEPSNKDIGDRLFLELLARNFFQDPHVSNEGNITYCKMHDLVHDLARHVAGEESKLLVGKSSIQTTNGLLHLNTDESEVASSLVVGTRMRSLVLRVNNDTFRGLVSKFQYLRILKVELTPRKELPNSIGKLIHLRYLDIDCYGIEVLPYSITRLENLQTLRLEYCSKLKKLPSDFCKLINLINLHLPQGMYAWTDLPSGFGKLTSLRKLNGFIVGKSNGIDSLPSLNFRGHLEITFREWRQNAIIEAQRASIKNNDRLTSLRLLFKEESTPNFDEMNAMINHLQLPPNLRDLLVTEYKGDEMPSRWLEGLTKLESVRIKDCKRCRVVPHLSQLPCLRSIELNDLNVLEYLEDEDNVWVGGGGKLSSLVHNIYFPSLEVLQLQKLPRLKGWTRASKNDSEQRQLLLPRLLNMNVVDCPELMSMPQTPRLESLIVENIEWKVFESNVASHDDEKAAASWSISSAFSPTLFTSLKELSMTSVTSLVWLSISSSLCNLNELTIVNCEELRTLRFESTNSIQKLEIMRCKRLRNIDGLQYLSFLERLQIIDGEVLEMEEEAEEGNTKTNITTTTTTSDNRGCQSQWQGLTRLRHLELMTIPKWKKLPSGIACLTTLKKLSISDLDSLIELPQDIGNLCLLDRLYICECPKLKSLPKSLPGLTSLQSLGIKECPHLEERYKKPDGEDCHLIQHIPKVEMINRQQRSLSNVQLQFPMPTAGPKAAERRAWDQQDQRATRNCW